MFRWIVATFFTVIFSANLFAQENYPEIKGSGSALFLDHKVLPKESLYSIGRMYNVEPKILASFNHLPLESGLSVGQEIKVPLEKSNFSQSATSSPNESLVPLYHTVQPKETLYRLGVTFNKVPVSSLKKWNNLTSDAVSEGAHMIVGFLKIDKNKSSLFHSSTTVDVAETPATPAQNDAEKVKPEVVEKMPVTAKTEPINSDQKQTEEAPQKQIPVSVKTNSNINFAGGYFKRLFEQQVQDKTPFFATGQVGTFKSTSGWQDGKYYCFNNDAKPGTVIKITDNNTGNIVYAKVLDGIPDIKQNAGLQLILSNAAAEELGESEGGFNCVLSYIK